MGGKNDNGVIILLARDERKIWISPGYGLEQYLSAGITGEIVRDIIIPEFKAGSYYNGLDKGADAIFAALKGEFNENRDFSKENGPPIELIIIIIFIIIIIRLFCRHYITIVYFFNSF